MFAAGRPSLPAAGGSRILDSIRLAIFYNGDVEITSCEAKVSSLKRRKYLSPFLISFFHALTIWSFSGQHCPRYGSRMNNFRRNKRGEENGEGGRTLATHKATTTNEQCATESLFVRSLLFSFLYSRHPKKKARGGKGCGGGVSMQDSRSSTPPPPPYIYAAPGVSRSWKAGVWCVLAVAFD